MKKILQIFVLITLFIVCIVNISFASNFATTIGTVNHTAIVGNQTSTITTTSLTYAAADHYSNMGYESVKRLADPGYTLLTSNLAGKVQLFCTHGSYDSIVFTSKTGLVTGKTRSSGNYEMIGVSDVARSLWKDNTQLVTYMCCNTAGEDGKLSIDSLAYETVSDGGVNAALGFKEEISYSDAEVWSERYHTKLEAGSSVYDAAKYANSALRFLR